VLAFAVVGNAGKPELGAGNPEVVPVGEGIGREPLDTIGERPFHYGRIEDDQRCLSAKPDHPSLAVSGEGREISQTSTTPIRRSNRWSGTLKNTKNTESDDLEVTESGVRGKVHGRMNDE
jgi:hypothetical protein